jgi:hypothetical protein
MKVTPRMRRTLIVFLAGFVPFAVFWPIYGALAALGIGLMVAAAVMAIDALVISRRKTRREA